jgi:hypothetical protein
MEEQPVAWPKAIGGSPTPSAACRKNYLERRRGQAAKDRTTQLRANAVSIAMSTALWVKFDTTSAQSPAVKGEVQRE